MRPVGAEFVRQVDAVALDGDVAHQVAPLVFEEVLASLDPVKDEVASARGEVARVRVSRAMELERDVRVDPDREVIVEHLQGESVDGALGALLDRIGFCRKSDRMNNGGFPLEILES